MEKLKDFINLANVTIKDKTSGKRMHEIIHILHENHVVEGLTPEKAVNILEELGPTFVKIGQMSSTRSDLLPPEYCKAFEKLHTDVSPMPFEQVLQCIDDAYGRSWNEVFLAIDPKPLGSASIAQVHRAVLIDGSVVAVKVRRPGIVSEMYEDFTLIDHVIATAEFVSIKNQNALLNIETMMGELEKTTKKELDFTVELDHLVKFREVVSTERGVTAPIPYPNISNEAVLVMEYVEGLQADDVAALKKQGVDMDKLGNRILQSFITQVIEDGYFQADPHAGNIIIRMDENQEPEIIWIDLGMVGTLTRTQQELVGKMFRAISTKNAYELMVATTGLCKPGTHLDQTKLVESLGAWLDRYAVANLTDVNMGDILTELIEMFKAQQLIILPEITLLVRSVVTIEGLIEEIAPNTSVMGIVSQYVIKQAFNVKKASSKAMEVGFSLAESAEAASKIPVQISNTFDMLERGEITVRSDMQIPDTTLSMFRSVVGIISLALISAGLFIGSSFICLTNMEPKILEVPLLGFLGFIGAFILGVYVIWKVIKRP